MKELMMNEDFTDVTLVTEDKKHIKANANILSACSPVFKAILKKQKNSSPIIYFRGIQYSEMESIMQFIYLGEATFYEERMEEFLAVAKSLEIKKLCNAETETNDEPQDQIPSKSETTIECFEEIRKGLRSFEEKTVVSDHSTMLALQERQSEEISVNINGRYECEQCHKTYSNKQGLHIHKQSAHNGVKYPCDQCDYQATQKGDLTKHIQSKHEGVRYDCHQCDSSYTSQDNLSTHFKSKHEGVRYACDYCDFNTAHQYYLKKHIKNYHKLTI